MAVLVVLVVLVQTAPSHAEVVGSTPFTPLVGPTLAGDRVVWAERTAEGTVVRSAGPQGTGVVTTPAPGPGGVTGLAASGDLLALEMRLVTCFGRLGCGAELRVFAAEGDGAFAPLDEPCELSASGTLFHSLDVVGKRVGFLGRPADADAGSCSGRTAGPGGATAQRSLPADSFGVQVAGGFDAWLEGREDPGATEDTTTEVVADAATGRELARVPPSRDAGQLLETDLRDDGALALLARVSRRSPGTRLSVLTPGGGVSRVPDVKAYGAPIRWIGERLSYVARSTKRPPSARRRTGCPPLSGCPTALGVRLIEPGTGQRTEVLLLPPEFRQTRAFDLDDDEVAHLERGCDEVRIIRAPYVDEAADATVRPRFERCALRLDRGPRLSQKRVRVNVSCRGFSSDCTARVRVRRHGRLIADGVTGRGGVASLAPTRAGRRLAARGGRVRVKVTARFTGSYRLGGDPEERSATRRLR